MAVDNTGSLFDGNVYVSWTNAVQNVLNVVFVRSTDGGASFSTPIPLSSSNLNQGSMTAVGPDGDVYVVWVESRTNILIRKSSDGGGSFAPAVRVAAFDPIGAPSIKCDYCGLVLKGDLGSLHPPIIAVDRSAGASRGKVYVVFANASRNDASDVDLTSSGDGGGNMERSVATE